jgi:16S rRNA (guanine527-N7)-methyltransferase
MGAAVSRETEATMRRYQALLHKWQEKINLISPTTLKDSWARHFEDSLQLLPLLPERAATLYDLGSGAGFPGMVLAIARPDLSVTLIESDAKKCAFLQAVSRETGIKTFVENSRIEIAAATMPPPDLVSARALASLSQLFKYVRPWAEANPALTVIFPKGAGWQDEIGGAIADGWVFEARNIVSETDRHARILVITGLRKTSV